MGLLVFRLGYAASLIAFHGWPRVLRAFNYFAHDQPWTFVNLVAGLGFPMPVVFAVLSVLAESLVPLLAAAGLWARAMAVLMAANFAVAVASEAGKGDPIELPGMYLIGALLLVFTGAGRFAVTKMSKPRRARQKQK